MSNTEEPTVEAGQVEEEEEWVPDYDFCYKTIITGDPSTGKSQISARWSRDEFSEDYTTTVGVEFATKKSEIDSKVISQQLWDTSPHMIGEEGIPVPLIHRYCFNVFGAFLVYDITKPDTFKNIPERLDVLRTKGDIHPKTKIIIMGNKSDLKKDGGDQVDTAEAKAYADENGFFFAEVSALDGSGIQDAFKTMVQAIWDEPEFDGSKSKTYELRDEIESQWP
ncbi:hypothetical protein TWF694_008372 [Orbilia ellipsospora]|uniref:Uncharacterized protein n=1 Tax=Orbilia ellipsospora TaxID=2528407 RepID=A0AAV9XGB2_9PEZI